MRNSSMRRMENTSLNRQPPKYEAGFGFAKRSEPSLQSVRDPILEGTSTAFGNLAPYRVPTQRRLAGCGIRSFRAPTELQAGTLPNPDKTISCRMAAPCLRK